MPDTIENELPASIDTLDGVPEPVQPFYRRDGEEGPYTLSVKPVGDLQLSNSGSVNKTISTLRTDVKTRDVKLRQFESDLADRDSKIETLTAEHGDLDKKAEQLAEQRVKEIAAKHAKSLDDKDVTIGELEGDIRNVLLERAAANALEKYKGRGKILLPHVLSQCKIVRGEDGKRHVLVEDSDGNPRYSDPVAAVYMTVDDLVKSMKDDDEYAFAFEGSAGSGAGSPPNGGGQPPGGGRGGVHFPKHRNDFPSTKEKSAWIAKHGREKFGDLPQAPKDEGKVGY